MHYFKIILLFFIFSCSASMPVLELEKSIQRVTVSANWHEIPVLLDFYFERDDETVKFIIWQMSSSPYLNKIDFDRDGKMFELTPGYGRYSLHKRSYDMTEFYRDLLKQAAVDKI